MWYARGYLNEEGNPLLKDAVATLCALPANSHQIVVDGVVLRRDYEGVYAVIELDGSGQLPPPLSGVEFTSFRLSLQGLAFGPHPADGTYGGLQDDTYPGYFARVNSMLVTVAGVDTRRWFLVMTTTDFATLAVHTAAIVGGREQPTVAG